MHSTLCLTQALHGFCRSHFTLRSAQRMHENVVLIDVLAVVKVAASMLVNGDNCVDGTSAGDRCGLWLL
jgi:hypothetical protein